jgi:excisionase family DNA binding protein
MHGETQTTEDARADRLVYTVAEAGELLGISRAFASELVARDELPVICLGRRRLVPKVALTGLVEQGMRVEGPERRNR